MSASPVPPGQSLWQHSAAELLEQTASSAPTPGGGAIAGVCAAFGLGLLEMAIAVTDAPALEPDRAEATRLRAVAVGAADSDVGEFDALMAAYRLPRDGDATAAARREAIDAATVSATHGPLALAEAAVAGIELADRIQPLVKATITSDVIAGADLLGGAVGAALATADINLAALERSGHPEAPALRARRDAVARRDVVTVRARPVPGGPT